jgi:hypothetical protein
LRDHDASDKMNIEPMNGHLPESQDGDPSLNATDLGCEAIYISNEASEGPGKWHFSQKYDEGRILFFAVRLTCRDSMEAAEMAMDCSERR